jgi:hypothetical protein
LAAAGGKPLGAFGKLRGLVRVIGFGFQRLGQLALKLVCPTVNDRKSH